VSNYNVPEQTRLKGQVKLISIKKIRFYYLSSFIGKRYT
jgi:hypothetical protein